MLWVLEEGLYDAAKFEKTVLKLGYEFKLIPALSFQMIPILPEDRPVVFMGYLNTVRNFNRTHAYPAYYCNLEKMKCTYYHKYFYKHLLNKDYTLVPAWHLYDKELALELFNRFGNNYDDGWGIFVRPDSGFKSFTGQVILEKNLGQSLKDLEIDPHALILISSPKDIMYEYRVWVCNNRVIDGCQYKQNGESREDSHCPKSILDWVQSIIPTDYSVEPYVIDVADDGYENYKVVEINSFSCAGLYEVDLEKVISKVSERAIFDYWDMYGEK